MPSKETDAERWPAADAFVRGAMPMPMPMPLELDPENEGPLHVNLSAVESVKTSESRTDVGRTRASLSGEIAKPRHVEPPTFTPAQREVQIEAAKLKVTLDRRLKRKTPKWIMDLASR